MSIDLSDELSVRAKKALASMASSGSSEAIAVVDCLSTIASNGGDQATDDYLIGCAQEINGWASSFIVSMTKHKPKTKEQ